MSDAWNCLASTLLIMTLTGGKSASACAQGSELAGNQDYGLSQPLIKFFIPHTTKDTLLYALPLTKKLILCFHIRDFTFQLSRSLFLYLSKSKFFHAEGF
ncbi:hypothetical protein Pfo_019427 [Paulownia fortunei]|nr:hypothetical protein Pfo_019427 [Paulownia fortunei]